MSDTESHNQRAKRHVELRTGTPYANLNAAQALFAQDSRGTLSHPPRQHCSHLRGDWSDLKPSETTS
jgi:hypothetical protein